MPTPIEPHDITWKTPGARGYGALALVLLGLFISVRLLIPAIEAATVSDEVAQAEEFNVQQQYADHDDDVERWVGVVSGRSPFFIPPKPIIEAPEVVIDNPEDTGDIPVQPRRYEGPDILAAINGRIVLEDESVIALGEEVSGVRLVHLDDVPWTVRVEWRGVEFDVQIFENTTNRFLSPTRDGE